MSRPYRFGFSEFTTWPWAFKKDVERYSAHGADCIEVCEFKLAHDDYGDDLASIAKAGMTVASVQAKVHSIFVDSMAPVPKDPRDRVRAIRDAIELSAPHLPKDTPFIVITGAPPDGNMREAIETTVESLKELGDVAARHGMKIAFEPLSPINVNTDTAVWGLDHGLDLVERVNHPAVGICVDTWNVWETPDLPQVIRRCGNRILVVQLSDWKTPRSTADRYSLGTGEIDLAGTIRAIRATGFAGPWVVEILSSLHLDGSLWKSDMDDVLRKNREAFERLWNESGAA
ncbi:MAG TPA: sugar phosphate isomerase/epimerase family protein [Candidatus Baltobacteraceae bacterium]|nr:sugar phosphate isomerase/epimerase family protein [Candidatus Baltobacteraceae bacterium]